MTRMPEIPLALFSRDTPAVQVDLELLLAESTQMRATSEVQKK